MLNELKAHPILGKLLLGVIPMNETVSYAYKAHRNVFAYDPRSAASRAYAKLVGRLVRQMERV